MKQLFFVLCFVLASCTVKTSSPPVQVAVPQAECPDCLCPTCDHVEIGQCYHMLGFAVLFPVYDEVTGEIKEVIPVPSLETGCYCRLMVNDIPALSSFPMGDHMCVDPRDQGDEDGSGLDEQGSPEETP